MNAAAVGGRQLPARLSPTALNRFLTCPKQFLLADIERAPKDDRTTPILAQANAVHHALERFFGLPLEARDAANLERALRAVWPRHRKPDTFASADEEATYGRAALEMLAKFASSFDLRPQPLCREQWVQLRLGPVEVFGKIDRVDPGRHSGIDVIDYKTGRRPLDVGDLPREPAVQVYVLGAEAVCQREVERVRFIYLALGIEVVWEPEREDIEVLRSRLATTLRAIEAEKDFAAAPGAHCRWCSFAAICPERTAVSIDDLRPVEGLPF